MKKILKEDKKKIDEEDFKDEITRFYNFFLNHTILQFILKFDIWGKENDKREREKELTKEERTELINNWEREEERKKERRRIDKGKKEKE